MKILIVKTSALGDIIHLFPAVSYLKERYPSVQIDWVVEQPFAELLEAHPDIHRVIQVQTKKWRQNLWKCRKEISQSRQEIRREKYDILFDLQGNLKSSAITLFARSVVKVGFGWKTVPEWPNLLVTHRRYNPPKGYNIRDDYLSVLQQHFNNTHPYKQKSVKLHISSEERKKIMSIVKPNGENVMVCPGSAWPNKQLPEEKLLQLLNQIDQDGVKNYYFLWGNEHERELCVRLQKHFSKNSVLIDRLPLPLLQNLMAEMDKIIAMDSLPLHLAGTTSTPTLSFFGPSSAHKYRPKGSQHISHQGTCPYGKTFDKRCPILRTCKDAPCINKIPI